MACAAVVAAALAVTGHAGSAIPACVEAASPHHATLVVTHLSPERPSPVRLCVGFAEDHISGHELLARSGIDFGLSEYGGNGAAVCRLDQEPQTYDANNCLQAGKPYWSIWQAPYGGSWRYTRFGIDGMTIHDGDAAGFRFAQNQGPPDAAGGLCPAPAASSQQPSGGVAPGTAASQPGGGNPSSNAGSSAPPGGGAPESSATADAPSQPAAAGSGAPPGPGEALVAPPSPTATPQRPRLQPALVAAPPRDTLGLAVAGVGALVLALLLCAQLFLPRRRG